MGVFGFEAGRAGTGLGDVGEGGGGGRFKTKKEISRLPDT